MHGKGTESKGRGIQSATQCNNPFVGSAVFLVYQQGGWKDKTGIVIIVTFVYWTK
jgi:hypothetical protein